jgi:hypothetical protein
VRHAFSSRPSPAMVVALLAAVSITNTGPGLFTVFILNPVPSPGAFVDDAFTLIAP